MITRPVSFKVDNLNINGLLYSPGEGRYPTVCICHGIPAGIPNPADRGYPLLAERICAQGFAVLIFNFRGTGSSEGNLDLRGWTKDLTAAIGYLYSTPEVDVSRVTLLGFSAGAAISVCVAAKDKRISAVAACACPAEFGLKQNTAQVMIDRFRSIGAIRDPGFPASPEEWLEGFKQVRPIQCIAEISPRPILLVHGKQDDVVEVSSATRLFEKTKEPKQLVIIEDAGHRLRLSEPAMTAVIDWLKSKPGALQN